MPSYKLDHEHPCRGATSIREAIDRLRAEADRLEELAKAGVNYRDYKVGPPFLSTSDPDLAAKYGMKEEKEKPWPVFTPLAPPQTDAQRQQAKATRVRQQIQDFFER